MLIQPGPMGSSQKKIYNNYPICSHPSDSREQPFSLARSGVYLLDSPLTLRIKLNRGGLFWIEDMKGRIINRFAGWTVLVKGPPEYENMEAESSAD